MWARGAGVVGLRCEPSSVAAHRAWFGRPTRPSPGTASVVLNELDGASSSKHQCRARRAARPDAAHPRRHVVGRPDRRDARQAPRPDRPGRHALVEACWSTVRQPGPFAAFYERIKARRGHQVAIVASAGKLACPFRCLLTRGEDYAFAQPSLTQKETRRLELAAGAPRWQGGRTVWSTNRAMRHAERELALQAQRAYQRTVADRQATKAGAGATPGRASSRPSKRQAARQTSKPQRSAL
jgi:hypothetical protein